MTFREVYQVTLLVFFVTNVFACPDSAIPYEDIADALQTSKAVYDDKLSINSLVPYTSFHIKKVYLFDNNELDEPCIDGSLKVIIAERAFTTIVAMKGPNGPTSVKPELFKYLQIFKGTEVIFAGNHTSINICFWKSFKIMLPSIRNQLQDQARKYIITGHSTGGAIASILALYMKVQEGRMWENSGTCLITFGQPRVGDELFAKLHDSMIDPFRKLRFINDKDPIPHVPIWKTAVHHSREIWMAYEPMTNKSYWKVCGNMDPLKCSNMWVLHTSPENHAIKSYENFIMNPPSVFLDKFSTRYKRWLDALQNSCVVNYKIEKIEHKGILDINIWKKQRTV
ncbi:uncharacterized protein LOC101241114 [Hydra vulgaris]|uniref:uncharacterized protein LOC101241114 n=1 Tax=Hydra vulgaris TaxID=6087 RepID=UPI000640D276|nr:uncharacterized protein LOC101241114 [Hydra vulgaris]XP_012561588.1 uncharacterized protein LOC101241114 [Hydra vulgaris]